MSWKISLSVICGLAVLIQCKGPQPDEQSQAHYGIIESEELAQIMTQAEGVAILDMRTPASYRAGHIPNAINIWRTDIERHDLPYHGMSIDKDSLALFLGSKGISSTDLVVIYDDKGCVDAARLWWIMKRYGHERVRLLNGGLNAWTEIRDTVATERTPVVFTFSGMDQSDMNLDYEAFEKLRMVHGVKLIDSRSQDEFTGKTMKSGALAAGHIPGAQNQCYTGSIDFSEEGQMRLKKESALREMYEKLAMPDDTVIVYCHSGVRSAHTYMVLTEVLGYKHVYNYDGSWVEWSHKKAGAPLEVSTI